MHASEIVPYEAPYREPADIDAGGESEEDDYPLANLTAKPRRGRKPAVEAEDGAPTRKRKKAAIINVWTLAKQH